MENVIAADVGMDIVETQQHVIGFGHGYLAPLVSRRNSAAPCTPR